MNGIEELFKNWKNLATYDSDLIKELIEIGTDRSQIVDRFYKNLGFGTAGIRGIIGAGINRMNVYVVGGITQAFSSYLNSLKNNNLVVIGFDNRIKSELFAKIAAQVLVVNGIRVKIFKKLKPVPILSYAVRFLKCDGGIMITASHNSADYNGYKIYGDDGCQVLNSVAEIISSFFNKINLLKINFGNFEEGLKRGLISFLGDEVEQSFLNSVEKSLIHPEILNDSGLKLIYTPLNGTGLEPIQRMLKKFNIRSVKIVEQQKEPDGNFPTCKDPNPENIEAFDLALKYCRTYRPDVAIANDPDCDRIGVVALNSVSGKYEILNGNQIGVLMFEYICRQRLSLATMPEKPIAIKTIVATPMAEKIAQHYGVELKDVLTGFKYIGKAVSYLEQKKEQDRFIFGFEESQGYLAGSYVFDKDGVFAAIFICEMVIYYKKNHSKTLIDVLYDLYEKFGYYKSSIQSYVLTGKSGIDRMLKVMDCFRNCELRLVGGFKVLAKFDYFLSKRYDLVDGSEDIIKLPKSNVLEFRLESELKVIIRVSGTEPKIKIYYHVTGKSRIDVLKRENELREHFEKLIKKLLES